MAKLQGTDHNKKGRGMEYLYLNVHDEDRDGEFIYCTIFWGCFTAAAFTKKTAVLHNNCVACI